MLNRWPKTAKTEEDLLQFQKEFLSGQTNPSASLYVRKPGAKRKPDPQGRGDAAERDNPQSSGYTALRDVVQLPGLPSQAPAMCPTPPVKKSRFKASREAKSKECEILVDADDPESRIDDQDRSTAAVLTEIMERDTRNAAVFYPRSSPHGFPSVLHRGSTQAETKTTGTKKQKVKKSIFAQQIERCSASEFGVNQHQEQVIFKSADNVPKTDPQFGSNILQGSDKLGSVSKEEVQKIHRENLSQLSAMSEEEILTEQTDLLETLDPELVAFLKSKKSAKLDEISEDRNRIQSEHVAMETHDDMLKLKGVPVEVLQEEQSSGKTEIPIEVDKEWVHMDVIESEKLAWMKDLPLPRTDNSKTDKPARFDFHGKILLADSDLPVTLGLHHHGEEPERPGYTLEELFQLCRSSQVQQRCLALQTLARIILKAKEGCYINLLQSPILPTILEAGVVFLIRWAMDDSVDGVIVSALSVLHSLVVNPADEAGLDEVFSWSDGVTVVSQCPVTPVQEVQESAGQKEEDPEDELDVDVVKKDLIQGLVSRMTILTRLRHYLSTWRPQALSVLHILSVLTRIARHSQTLAYQVMSCPGLIATVVKEFLPTSWKSIDTAQPLSHLYGYPVPAAVKLLRTVAQAGRNMAAILISKHKVLSQVIVYLSMDTCDINLHPGEAVCLQREAYRLWRVCLLYGLGAQHYLDLYGTLIRRLTRAQSVLRSDDNPDEVTLTTDLIKVLQAVVVIAGSATSPTHTAQTEGPNLPSGIPPNPLTWTHVTDLLLPVKVLWEKHKRETVENFQNKKQSLTLAGSLLDFLKTFYSTSQKQIGVKTVELLEDLEGLSSGIRTMWTSLGFEFILSSLSGHSNILSEKTTRNTEVLESLPELTADLEETLPLLQPHSPIPFVANLLSLVYTVCQIHKGMIEKLLFTVMADKSLKYYLKKVGSCRKRSCLQNNYFTKFENHLQYRIIKLASLMPDADNTIYHETALSLITRLHYGDEHLVHDLMSLIIYNISFIREGSDEEKTRQELEGMSLSDATYLKSATQEEIHSTQGQLLSDAVSNLPAIRATYLTAFSHMSSSVIASRTRHLDQLFEIQSFITSNIGESLMPSDWMFFPLVDLYNRSLCKSDKSTSSSGLVQKVTYTLAWVYLLEKWQPGVMSKVPVTLKVTRVMCVFLAGNDLFLDRHIHCYLAGLLREYTKIKSPNKLDFEVDIPGLTSFYELYISLLQHYRAVSFGDALFGCYVLIPLQQQHNGTLRKAVWGEYSDVLRSLSIPVTELLFPIECYLVPEETDVALIRLYTQSLVSETVRHWRSPIMYLIAVHHVNRFMYTQDGCHTALKHRILKQVLSLKKEALKKDLIYYKCVKVEAPRGMELYEELSPIRQALIRKYDDDN